MQKRLHPRLVQPVRLAHKLKEDMGPDPSLGYMLLWRHKTQHPPSRL